MIQKANWSLSLGILINIFYSIYHITNSIIYFPVFGPHWFLKIINNVFLVCVLKNKIYTSWWIPHSINMVD